RVHGIGQFGKAHAGAGQVLVHAMEVDAPVAVVAGLSAVAEDAVAARRRTAGEGLVGIVDDRRDPDRAEAHALDVVEIVGQPPEAATEVADVAGHAVAGRQRDVERAVGAALVAVVVAGVAVDEAVGEHEVHRVAGERLQRAVEFATGDFRCIAGRVEGRPGRAHTAGGQRGRGQDGKDQVAHGQASPVAARGRTVESGRRTRSVHSPAMNMQMPPSMSTRSGSPSNSFDSSTPRVLTATSCGITMKKLKMPMYTPIFAAGRLSDSIAYGSDRIEAHAKPTPTIDSSSHCGSRTNAIDSRPRPPSHRLSMWLPRSPMRRASHGIAIAASAAKPLQGDN